MKVSELKERARVVVDADGGKAIMLDYAIWAELMEELEDMEAIDEARESGEGYIPWEQALENLGLDKDKLTRPFGLCAGEFVVPDDFDDPLPDHVIEEFEASDDQSG